MSNKQAFHPRLCFRMALILFVAAVPAATLFGALGAAASAAAADIGPVTGCQYRPPFMVRLKIPSDARMSTATPGIVGFNILMHDPREDRLRPFVHGSWKAAGNLGQYTSDAAGNLYLVPVPLTSLELNPPEDQNKIHVIDGQTGRMRELIDLPAPKPIGAGNPFGAIGIAYDCETNSLYVASLAGSSATEELGAIFRIDLDTNEIASRIDGVDALGLGVFKGFSGKRLYFGRGRIPEVHSIAVDEHGSFDGEPRKELDLAELDLPHTYRAQKIRFKPGALMQLKLLPFAYSLRLIGPEDIAVRTLRYLPGDSWEAVE